MNTVSWAKPRPQTLLHYRIENDFLEVKSKWIRKDKRGNILLDDFIKKSCTSFAKPSYFEDHSQCIQSRKPGL